MSAATGQPASAGKIPSADGSPPQEARARKRVRDLLKKLALALIALGAVVAFFRFMQVPSAWVASPIEGYAVTTAIGVLGAIGLWREVRAPRPPLDLTPSVWAGVLGGLIGGAVAGAVIGWLYFRENLDAVFFGHGFVFRLRPEAQHALFLRIWVFCTAIGVVLGASIQFFAWACWRYASGRSSAIRAIRGMNEVSGAVAGGIFAGVLCGAAGGMYFGKGPGTPPPIGLLAAGGALGALVIAVGAAVFDYAGRLAPLVRPFATATVLTGALGGAAALVANRPEVHLAECPGWAKTYWSYFLAERRGDAGPEPDPPDGGTFVAVEACRATIYLDVPAGNRRHAQAGILYGVPVGALVGLEVGISVFVDRIRRRRDE